MRANLPKGNQNVIASQGPKVTQGEKASHPCPETQAAMSEPNWERNPRQFSETIPRKKPNGGKRANGKVEAQ